MAEHTPGPWVISDSNGDNDVYVSKAGMYVAIVVSPIYTPWPDDEKEKMANARLIAAAPDLLAACDAAIAFICGGSGDGAIVDEQLHRAVSQARAEGKENAGSA